MGTQSSSTVRSAGALVAADSLGDEPPAEGEGPPVLLWLLLHAAATRARLAHATSAACFRRADRSISTRPFLASAPWRPRGFLRWLRPERYIALPFDAQGTKMRSINDTNANNASAINVRIKMAAKMRAVCRFGVACCIT